MCYNTKSTNSIIRCFCVCAPDGVPSGQCLLLTLLFRLYNWRCPCKVSLIVSTEWHTAPWQCHCWRSRPRTTIISTQQISSLDLQPRCWEQIDAPAWHHACRSSAWLFMDASMENGGGVWERESPGQPRLPPSLVGCIGGPRIVQESHENALRMRWQRGCPSKRDLNK